MAVSGIIIRHLVLPGFVENSLRVVRFIAEELSPRMHVSLMSQYYPTTNVMNHKQLGRGINRVEYQAIVDEMERLGMYKGWIQEFSSSDFYRPDFNFDHPFEGEGREGS
jgi:putative pyruvate formate lyase activating enzyme